MSAIPAIVRLSIILRSRPRSPEHRRDARNSPSAQLQDSSVYEACRGSDIAGQTIAASFSDTWP